MRPAMISVAAGAAPRNGTCTIGTPTRALNISPRICPPEPTPCEPKLKPPGLVLASAARSATVFTGLSGGTTRMCGNEMIGVIGAKSLTGSKRRSGNRIGLTDITPMLVRNSV